MPRKLPTSGGGVGSGPLLGVWGRRSLYGLVGALFVSGLALESWARRAVARALQVQEAALRAEFRDALEESQVEAAFKTARLERRITLETQGMQAFKDDANRRFSGLDEGASDVRGLVARLDRRSDRGARKLDSMRDDLESLDRQVSLHRPTELRFKEIQKENEDSVLFIYSEVSLRNSTGSVESTIGTYGTGFIVSKEGHIATSKHVAQPWKFREFARQIAIRGLEVDPESHLIAAWRSGTAVLDTDGDQLDLDIGYNNLKLNNLRVWSAAEDRYRTETVEDFSGQKVEIRYHDSNDNQDLVLLKAEGEGPFRPVKIVTDKVPEKLDPVMVLGFPRGLDILERGVAESSPSLGTVRKVEETIYVTASIIPGNSGGPVFDPQGEVVGIATRVVQGTETLGICLKTEHLVDLIRAGEPSKAPTVVGPTVTLTTR